jgi:NitT/TauT family transport system substrate-binding protein
MKQSSTLTRSAFVAGTAAFALAPAASRAASGDLTVIRAATLPSDSSAVIVFASALGYFKDVGLDVQIQTFSNGPTIAQAVIGGSLDVGTSNVASIASARESGLPLKFFATSSISGPTVDSDPVMVRKDSPIKSVADLNGKTVAIAATKTLQHATFMWWVDKHGGDSKSIKFIEMPLPAMLDAMLSGRVDVALVSSITIAQGSADMRGIGQIYSVMPTNILVFGYFATDAWLAAHPDLAAKFAGAIFKAAAWANTHHKESAAMIAAFAKIEPDIANKMNRAVYATTLNAAELQPVIDNAVRYNMLPKPMDARELIWTPPAK